jgi:hypothetical protein
MNDDMDVYIGRCLKNWTAKFRPPADGKAKLLRATDYPLAQESPPFGHFFSTFANRWSSPGEQFYAQRHWQLISPFSRSIHYWTFHLAAQQRLAN